MSNAAPGGRAASPSTRFRRLVASGCASHGVNPSRYSSLNSRCFDDIESDRSEVGRQPVLRLQEDGDHRKVLAPGEFEISVDLFRSEVALGHLYEVLVGAFLDAADRTVDRDITHRRLEALGHQREL